MKFVSKERAAIKTVKITDPLECRVRINLLVKNSDFPKANLAAAHAAILLLDATKSWNVNQGIIKKLLLSLKMEENGHCYRLYSYVYQFDPRKNRILEEDDDLAVILRVDSKVKHLGTIDDIDDT